MCDSYERRTATPGRCVRRIPGRRDRPHRAAGKRLEPHRSRTCIEIENARAFDPRRDDVEDVLAHAVGSRTRLPTAWREDRVALALARDDSHGTSLGAVSPAAASPFPPTS